MKTSLTLLLFFLFASQSILCQHVVTLKANKVEVRDIKGKYLASAYYNDLTEAISGSEIIVLRFESGRIEVRSSSLNRISSQYFNSVEKIATAQDYVVIYYQNGRVEVRDQNLNLQSSWYF